MYILYTFSILTKVWFDSDREIIVKMVYVGFACMNWLWDSFCYSLAHKPTGGFPIWFSQHIQKNAKIINYSFLIVVRRYNIKTQKLSDHLDGCQTARTAFNHLLGFCFVSGLRISFLAHFIRENELHI